MTEIKSAAAKQAANAGPSKGLTAGQDISRPASAESETPTLPDDLPPSYDEHTDFVRPQNYGPGNNAARPGPASPTAQAPSQQAQSPTRPRMQKDEVGPTIAEPFHFPTNAVPSYSALDPVRRPLAIPQFVPSPTAPFLPAYPSCLLSFGIPAESWRPFVETLSAFLSAAIGTQAVQHAADIGWQIAEAHKDWGLAQKDHVISLGRKAQRGDLFGVIGGTLGLTIGTAGHIVDSVLKFPGRLVQKPQTPRERADAYVATANRDWLNQRGLHARIVDTVQLADLADTSVDSFVRSNKRGRSVGDQLVVLQEWIAEMDVHEVDDCRGKPSKKTDNQRLPLTVAPAIEITKKTLWLTLLKLDEEEMYLAQQQASE